MAVNYIPDGYHTVTPYLTVRGASKLLDFLKTAFDAQETVRMMRPDGTIGHAEVRIGDSAVMLGEASAEWKQTSATLYLYVKDADATYASALRAGATSLREPANQFYGDRHGAVTDPLGNSWWIATHIEDVSADEMKKRSAAAMQQQS
jgi:PhnB protein